MPLAVPGGEGKLEVHYDRDHDTEDVLFSVLVYFNLFRIKGSRAGFSCHRR